MPKHTHTVKYTLADGTIQTKKYNWKKYDDFYCQCCDKTVGYHSKSRHVKSLKHLRTKKLYDELMSLKSTPDASNNKS